MAKAYTFEEVKEILCAVQMFANSNNHQGLGSVKGHTFDEKADHIVKSYDKTEGSIYNTVQLLRGE